jgi:hypothetical protein
MYYVGATSGLSSFWIRTHSLKSPQCSEHLLTNVLSARRLRETPFSQVTERADGVLNLQQGGAILFLNFGNMSFEGGAGVFNTGMDGLQRVRFLATGTRKLASVRARSMKTVSDSPPLPSGARQGPAQLQWPRRPAGARGHSRASMASIV